MVFKIPAPAGHLKKNRFEFQLPDGEVVSVPKLEYTPPEGEAFLDEAAEKGLSNREFVLGFIEAIDAELGKKLRAAGLSRDQVTALHAAWLAAGKIEDEGESEGSERS